MATPWRRDLPVPQAVAAGRAQSVPSIAGGLSVQILDGETAFDGTLSIQVSLNGSDWVAPNNSDLSNVAGNQIPKDVTEVINESVRFVRVNVTSYSSGEARVVIYGVEDAQISGGSSADIATAIEEHEAATNPHPTYLTEAEADALYAPIGGEGAGVSSFNSRTGDVTPQSGDYSASDVGADAAGTAAAAITTHEEAVDPHPDYLTQAEADALYDPTGTAASAITTHEEAVDPHPDYLTEAEANVLYDGAGTASAAITTHEEAVDPHPDYLTQTEADALYDATGTAAAAITTHEGAENPHPGYLTQAEADALYAPISVNLSTVVLLDGREGGQEISGDTEPGGVLALFGSSDPGDRGDVEITNLVANLKVANPAAAGDIGMSAAGIPLIYIGGEVRPVSYVIGTSGTVTLANGASTTITHGDLGTTPPVISAAKLTSSTPTQTILLHLNGSDGSTTITDTGSNAESHTWSVSGNTQIDTAYSKFGGGALLFDGNGDSLRLAATPDMEFTGPLTISFWIRPTSITGIHVLFAPSDTLDNFQLAFYSDGRIDLYEGNTQVCTSSAGAITAGSWQHIATTRDGSNVCKIWVNGVEVASGTRAGTIGRSDSQFNFGMYADGSYPYAGHFEELAVDTTCLYTTSFTPPTSAWADSEVVKQHLVLGTDYSAVTSSTGTEMTNISGSSYSAQFVLRA